MTKRDAVFPAGRQALYEKNRYSAAVRSGDLLFVSGQVVSCTRFPWTAICPTGGRHDEVHQERN